MNKPTILFDVDGFLLDFITPALEVASRVTGRGWSIYDFPSWDIFDTIGKEFERECYLEYEKPGFCASFEPYPGAVEGVREAKKMADVVVVTSPLHSPTWCHERVQSLQQHFDISRKDVIFASRKTLVMGRLLVDDNPRHVREWGATHYPQGMGILWDQPYNQSEVLGTNMYRVTGWEGKGTGLLSVIESLARSA